jgi:hypothetical protein
MAGCCSSAAPSSKSGIGVFGSGGTHAAKFEGNVEIDGTVKVGGVDLGAALQTIQQQISALQQQMAGGNSLQQLRQEITALQQAVATLVSQVTFLESNAANNP